SRMWTARPRILALSATIFVAVAAAPLRSSVAAGPAAKDGSAAASSSFSTRLLALGKAQALANEDPGAGIPKLRAAIDALREHPSQLVSDPAARQARIEALLVLARAQLNAGTPDAAAATSEEALRNALDGEIDGAALGPSLAKVVADQKGVLGARTQLELRCLQACSLTLNETPVSLDQGSKGAAQLMLWPGEYRL